MSRLLEMNSFEDDFSCLQVYHDLLLHLSLQLQKKSAFPLDGGEFFYISSGCLIPSHLFKDICSNSELNFLVFLFLKPMLSSLKKKKKSSKKQRKRKEKQTIFALKLAFPLEQPCFFKHSPH